MIICNKVQESCFEPIPGFKEACHHAIAHEKKQECNYKRCERNATYVDGKLMGIIFVDHVEI